MLPQCNINNKQSLSIAELNSLNKNNIPISQALNISKESHKKGSSSNMQFQRRVQQLYEQEKQKLNIQDQLQKKAPKEQIKMNYVKRQVIRLSSMNKFLMFGLFLLILFGILSFAISHDSPEKYQIKKNQGCPKYSTCAVVVECWEGYDFDEQTKICKVNHYEQIKASNFLQDKVNLLAQNYGNEYCKQFKIDPQREKEIFKENLKPRIQIKQILNQTKKISIRNILSQLIRNQSLQKEMNFLLNGNDQIEPKQMKISIACNSYIYFHKNLQQIFTCFSIIMFGIIMGIYIYLRQFKTTKRIYIYLKKEVKIHGCIDINNYTGIIYEMFPGKKSLSRQERRQIQEQRVKDDCIDQTESMKSMLWRLKK